MGRGHRGRNSMPSQQDRDKHITCCHVFGACNPWHGHGRFGERDSLPHHTSPTRMLGNCEPDPPKKICQDVRSYYTLKARKTSARQNDLDWCRQWAGLSYAANIQLCCKWFRVRPGRGGVGFHARAFAAPATKHATLVHERQPSATGGARATLSVPAGPAPAVAPA